MTIYTCSYLIALHYIFSYMWIENRIFNQFKEFDLCWYCQMSSKVLSFTWLCTQNIISNKFSQHWRAAWNQTAGRGLDSTALECHCDNVPTFKHSFHYDVNVETNTRGLGALLHLKPPMPLRWTCFRPAYKVLVSANSSVRLSFCPRFYLSFRYRAFFEQNVVVVVVWRISLPDSSSPFFWQCGTLCQLTVRTDIELTKSFVVQRSPRHSFDWN